MVGAVLVLSAQVALADDVPEIFSEASYKDATATAATDGKLLIVDAMTSWCAPCKRMDVTTWRDADVVKWVRKNAVAVQLDMDLHTDVKDALAVTAFPTIVALRDGAEVDRVVGYRSAQQMMVWLNGMLAGRTEIDRLREDLAQARAGGSEAWGRRAHIVDALLFQGEDAEALVEFTWLWQNAPNTAAAVRTRLGRLVFGMRELAEKSPPALAAFTALRETAAADVRGDSPDATAVRNWLALNGVIGDAAATADWADALTATDAGIATLREHEREVFGVLIAEGRWRAAGLALRDPVAATRDQGSQLGAYDLPAAGSKGKAPAAKGGSIPMIPMGGAMKPAVPMGGATKKKGTSMPAIPMGGMRPAVPMAGAGNRSAPQTPEERAAEVRRRLTVQFRRQASERYAALLAADRHDEAAAVASALLSDANDDRSRGSLLAAALRADQMGDRRDIHQRWLDELAD